MKILKMGKQAKKHAVCFAFLFQIGSAFKLCVLFTVHLYYLDKMYILVENAAHLAVWASHILPFLHHTKPTLHTRQLRSS